MSGRFTDVLDGTPPRLEWPVVCWRSPIVDVVAPTELYINAPIPSFALFDLGHEMRGAPGTLGYDLGDITRGQRCRIAGANNYMHLAWDAPRSQPVIISGNASNAYYYGHKTTGAGVGSTQPAWDQRVYGAWPLTRDAAILGRLPRSGEKGFVSGGMFSILRRKWVSPWVRAGAFPLAQKWSILNVSHGDEPAFVQLWGKCLDQDQGFQTDDELLLGGDDIGVAGAGQTVWHSNKEIGFAIASAGPTAVVGLTAGNLTPGKWAYQLRAAFAAPVEDTPTARKNRNGGELVAMHYTAWRRITGPGQRIEWQLPENFQPVEIGHSIRCISANQTWLSNDQVYSRSAAQLTWASFPQVLLQGRKAILQAPSSNFGMFDRSGAGGSVNLNSNFEVQLRAIG